MDTQHEHEQQQPEANEQETIFTEQDFSNQGYDKHIRQARNTLFIIAGLQLVVGIYTYFNTPDSTVAAITLGLTCGLGVIFLLLGFWTKNKPYTAIIIALVLYLVLWAGDCLVDPTYIFRGILVRIIIIVYLIKGLSDAKEAQQMKNNL